MTRPAGVVDAAALLRADLAEVREELRREKARTAGLNAELGKVRQRLGDATEKAAALRGEARGTSRALQAAQVEAEKLRTLLAQAEQHARDLQDDGVVPAGAVLRAYEAWQCVDGSPNCRRRFYADDPAHECGPLTPVTVTVSRRSP